MSIDATQPCETLSALRRDDPSRYAALLNELLEMLGIVSEKLDALLTTATEEFPA